MCVLSLHRGKWNHDSGRELSYQSPPMLLVPQLRFRLRYFLWLLLFAVSTPLSAAL